MKRCEECGSWEAECVADEPVSGCGCARCLRDALDRAQTERSLFFLPEHKELLVAFIPEIRAQALEEAARVAEDRCAIPHECSRGCEAWVIAAAIRSLKVRP